jgi:hypothetical protein
MGTGGRVEAGAFARPSRAQLGRPVVTQLWIHDRQSVIG